MKLQEDFD
jgi:hypothetical protein